MSTGPATLRELCADYLRVRPGLSQGYADEIWRTVRQFCRFLGRDPLLSELRVGQIADFMRLRLTGSSPVSVNNQRRQLMTLWRAAVTAGWAQAPGVVRPLPEPTDPPEAWRIEAVGQLLATCRALPGRVHGWPRADYYFALLLTQYYTSARIGALRQTRSEDVDLTTGWLRTRGRSQKSRHGQLYRLPPECIEAIRRIHDPARALVWPWPASKRNFFRAIRAIVDKSGIHAPRGGKNLTHKLRRTTITYCWQRSPTMAQQLAGHARPEMTFARYVDPTLLDGQSAADILPRPDF